MNHQSEKKQPTHSEQDVQKVHTAAAEQHLDHKSNNSRSAKESGGPSGPEPTRYGDWERKGRCIDF